MKKINYFKYLLIIVLFISTSCGLDSDSDDKDVNDIINFDLEDQKFTNNDLYGKHLKNQLDDLKNDYNQIKTNQAPFNNEEEKYEDIDYDLDDFTKNITDLTNQNYLDVAKKNFNRDLELKKQKIYNKAVKIVKKDKKKQNKVEEKIFAILFYQKQPLFMNEAKWGIDSYYFFEWLDLFGKHKIVDGIYFSLDPYEDIKDNKANEEKENESSDDAKMYPKFSIEDLRFYRIGKILEDADVYLKENFLTNLHYTRILEEVMNKVLSKKEILPTTKINLQDLTKPSNIIIRINYDKILANIKNNEYAIIKNIPLYVEFETYKGIKRLKNTKYQQILIKQYETFLNKEKHKEGTIFYKLHEVLKAFYMANEFNKTLPKYFTPKEIKSYLLRSYESNFSEKKVYSFSWYKTYAEFFFSKISEDNFRIVGYFLNNNNSKYITIGYTYKIPFLNFEANPNTLLKYPSHIKKQYIMNFPCLKGGVMLPIKPIVVDSIKKIKEEDKSNFSLLDSAEDLLYENAIKLVVSNWDNIPKDLKASIPELFLKIRNIEYGYVDFIENTDRRIHFSICVAVKTYFSMRKIKYAKKYFKGDMTLKDTFANIFSGGAFDEIYEQYDPIIDKQISVMIENNFPEIDDDLKDYMNEKLNQFFQKSGKIFFKKYLKYMTKK